MSGEWLEWLGGWVAGCAERDGERAEKEAGGEGTAAALCATAGRPLWAPGVALAGTG